MNGRGHGAVRPYFLGGLFVIAVLFLGAVFLNRGDAPRPEPPIDRNSPDAVNLPARNAASPDPEPVADELRSAPAVDNRPESPSNDADGAAENFRFTVAVAPLVLQTDEPRAVRALRSLFAAFLAELRSIPNLALVELLDGEEELTTDDADFLLRVSGDSRIEAEPIWSFDVRWSAMRGGNGSWIASEIASDPLAFEAIAADAAAALRRFPFPPPETRILELESRVLDTNLGYDERFDALDELQNIPRRYEFVGRDEQRIVAVAAVEIVANSPDPDIRSRVWAAMADSGADDPYLTGPLVDSVLNDPSEYVRMEAVKLLARSFAEDPRASAALDYVLSGDPSPRVITHARWELLDDRGRLDQVRSTVLNRNLSDVERLELLTTDVTGIRSYVEQAVETDYYGVGIGGDVASGQPSDSPELTPLLLEWLGDETSLAMRRLAASMLFDRFDEAGVREALERAAENDSLTQFRWEILFALRRIQVETP